MPDAKPRTFGDLEPSRWPGERLGLPDSGPGSVGRVGRRLGAIAIDWAAAILIALLFAPYSSVLHSWLTLAIFAIMQVVFIPTIGGSVGHRLTGMRARADRRRMGRPLATGRPHACCSSSSCPRSCGTPTSADSTTRWPARS